LKKLKKYFKEIQHKIEMHRSKNHGEKPEKISKLISKLIFQARRDRCPNVRFSLWYMSSGDFFRGSLCRTFSWGFLPKYKNIFLNDTKLTLPDKTFKYKNVRRSLKQVSRIDHLT
jgi:hypothetical protein